MAYDDRLSDEDNARFDEEAQTLQKVQGKGWSTKMKTYIKLSGPGWLQSAISLGGGSLASSLYLGVLTGYSMLWLQPVAMLLGIIMLSALGYVTLATNQRPFHAINEHINPILGWSWALGALLASIVWAMPQFALAKGVLQQNLFPNYLGPDSALGDFGGTVVVSIVLLAITIGVTWNYGRGSRGVRIYEKLLKGVVALVVLAFFGVVIRLMFIGDTINWGEMFAGLIPDPSLIFRPADGFAPLLSQLSESSAQYWSELIVGRQQDVIAAAISSAVGINMTFLFAYSMLRRKWGTEYKGLMKFDLATGMLIPFMLATNCVIIASASQFHTVPQPGFIQQEQVDWEPTPSQVSEYERLLKGRILFETNEQLSDEQISTRINQLGDADQQMASILITRDAFDLAFSLTPLLGSFFSSIVFGIGVLGMALSSISIMMVISGFVLCEIMEVSYESRYFKIGALLPTVAVLGTFLWNQALFWLAIPTSVITLLILPLAYVAFFLMLNNKSIMGKHMPRGRQRIVWNLLMGLAIVLVGTASMYMLWKYSGIWGTSIFGLFLLSIAGYEWYQRRN